MTVKEKVVLQQCNKLSSHRSISRHVVAPAREHNGPQCYACNQYGHVSRECRFRFTLAHIAAACRTSRKNAVNHIDAEQASDDEEQCELQLYCLNIEADTENAFCVDVRVNDQCLVGEIDTGAAVSAISSEVYTKHFGDEPLKRTSLRLRTYDGTTIPVRHHARVAPVRE